MGRSCSCTPITRTSGPISRSWMGVGRGARSCGRTLMTIPVPTPDGRWIAYWSDESGRNEVYVRPRSGASGRWQISNQGGTEPRSVLDDEIAYLNGTKIMTVPVKTSPVFTAGTPRLLLDANASDFDLARDGRVLIVVNWFEEIRRR